MNQSSISIKPTVSSTPGPALIGNAPWYLVQIRPNQHLIAERNLMRQDCKLFCPQEERTTRKDNRFEKQLRPLFPGYMFASFDPRRTRWSAINSTYGIVRLVSFRLNEPAEVPRRLVEALMERCDETGRLLPPQHIIPGDRIKILNGPFANFVATVDALAANQRVWVMLDLMNSARRVSIERESIQKSDD